MKLDVKFHALWDKVRQMGADRRDIDIGVIWDVSGIDFDKELAKGLEIKLEDLESEQGLLSVRGRQVILFIPDHSFKISKVIDDPAQGNKFHIADCKTLDNMRVRKRFERYKVTNNLSGLFEIFGSDTFGQVVEDSVQLNVCKNCLNMLNYHGSANCTVAGRNEIVSQFNVEQFDFLSFVIGIQH